MRRAILLLSAFTWACGTPSGDDGGVQPDAGHLVDSGIDAGEIDAGVVDAGVIDAGEIDSGVIDAGVEDAGVPDAGPAVPLPGFGAISGECGPLSAIDLNSPAPSTYETRIDFADLVLDAGLLSDGGYTLFTTMNAGGSSIESEAFAFEVLHRCEFAELAATETQVVYDPPSSKKTDIVVWLEGQVVGVSVARAFKYPPGSALTVADATNLLDGKFSDIHSSTANVQPPWQWNKQILHVIAYDDVARDAVVQAAMNIDAGVRGDTVLYITVTDGDDAFIY